MPKIWRLWVAAAIVAVVLAGASFAVGRWSVPQESPPSSTSAEAGFARDMQVHHQQAVELSLLLRDRTTDPDLRLIAYDIALTQSQQAGQLYGWLTQWGLPQAGEPSMTWMTRPPLTGSSTSHAHDPDSTTPGTAAPAHEPGSPMPGMATPEQVAELTAATGTDAERLFLELMIAHHDGGIEMANALLDRSTDPVVTAFARGVVASQGAEVETMTAMLAKY